MIQSINLTKHKFRYRKKFSLPNLSPLGVKGYFAADGTWCPSSYFPPASHALWSTQTVCLYSHISRLTRLSPLQLLHPHFQSEHSYILYCFMTSASRSDFIAWWKILQKTFSPSFLSQPNLFVTNQNSFYVSVLQTRIHVYRDMTAEKKCNFPFILFAFWLRFHTCIHLPFHHCFNQRKRIKLPHSHHTANHTRFTLTSGALLTTSERITIYGCNRNFWIELPGLNNSEQTFEVKLSWQNF